MKKNLSLFVTLICVLQLTHVNASKEQPTPEAKAWYQKIIEERKALHANEEEEKASWNKLKKRLEKEKIQQVIDLQKYVISRLESYKGDHSASIKKREAFILELEEMKKLVEIPGEWQKLSNDKKKEARILRNYFNQKRLETKKNQAKKESAATNSLVIFNTNSDNEPTYPELYGAFFMEKENINTIYGICSYGYILSLIHDKRKRFIASVIHKELSSRLYHITDSNYFLILPNNTNPNKVDATQCTKFFHNPHSTDSLEDQLILWITKKKQTKEDKINLITSLERVLSKQLEAKKSSQQDQEYWNVFLIGHGSSPQYNPSRRTIGGTISSMSFLEFMDLSSFLNKLNVKNLLVLSCYLGGENRDYITGQGIGQNYLFFQNKPLPLLKYTLILTSATEAIVTANWNIINKVMQNIGSEENNANWAVKIANTMSNDSSAGSFEELTNRIPLVLYPHHTAFQPVLPVKSKISEPLDQFWSKVSNINNTLIKQHAINKKPIIFKEKKVIFSNQSIISEPLIFTKPNLSEINTQISSTNADEHSHSAQPLSYRNWAAQARECSTCQNAINQLTEWEYAKHIYFPVESDFINRSDIHQNFMMPEYPRFLSLQTGHALHYFEKIMINPEIHNRSGIFLFLRDMFFNPYGRTSVHLYFIKELTGYNDLMNRNENNKKIPFPREKITLSNIMIITQGIYEPLHGTSLHHKSKTNIIFSYNNQFYALGFITYYPDETDPNKSELNTNAPWGEFIKYDENEYKEILQHYEKFILEIQETNKTTLENIALSEQVGSFKKKLRENIITQQHKAKTDKEKKELQTKLDKLNSETEATILEREKELLKKHHQSIKQTTFSWQHLMDLTEENLKKRGREDVIEQARKKNYKLYDSSQPLMLQVSDLYKIYRELVLGEQWEDVAKQLKKTSDEKTERIKELEEQWKQQETQEKPKKEKSDIANTLQTNLTSLKTKLESLAEKLTELKNSLGSLASGLVKP